MRSNRMRAVFTLMLTTALSVFTLPQSARADAFVEALTSAYETNPRIQAQRRVLEQSNEQVSQAIGQFRPTLNASYQNGRQRTSFDGSPRSEGDLENKTLNLNQPIFLGGANFFRYFGTKERMYANRETLASVEQEVLLDSVVAYMNVIRDYSVLELSRNNENVLRRQLEASRDRFSVGDVTRTDVAQSEARLARARADTIQAEGNLESSIAEFERVIGYRPENLPLPLPEALPPLPATLEDAVKRAQAHNPSVQSSHHAKEAADEDVGVAFAALLPQVSLQGTLSRQDGTGVTGASTFDSDQLLVNVSIPLYQNGSEYSAVRESELVSKQRKYELLDTKQRVREATIQAWENLQTAISTIESQQQQVEAAEIALDGVRQEHRFGARTVLDVLDAEQELFVARVDLVRAQRNRYVSVFNLLLLLGDLKIEQLGAETEVYDPEDHYDSVKWQLIGF